MTHFVFDFIFFFSLSFHVRKTQICRYMHSVHEELQSRKCFLIFTVCIEVMKIITLWGWENTEIRFIYLFICQSDYAFPLDSIFSSIVTFELIAQTYMWNTRVVHIQIPTTYWVLITYNNNNSFFIIFIVYFKKQGQFFF